MIAKAISHWRRDPYPRVGLLDEPTAGLDERRAARLQAELQRLHERGTTLVFATHDPGFAWRFADDVALFCDGPVIAQGCVGDVLVDEPSLAQAGLKPPLLARVGAAFRAAGDWPVNVSPPRDEDELLALVARGAGGGKDAEAPSAGS